jgi:hypothetical protein
MTAEADARATAAVAGLAAARDALARAIAGLASPPPGTPDPGLAPLLAALRGAALHGVPGAYPPPGTPPREPLLARARSVEAELGRRLQAAAAAQSPEDRVAAVFGRGFVLVPRFRPGSATELTNALRLGPALVPDEADRLRWLQQAAPVRAGLGRWRTMALYAQCLGAPLPVFDVVQLPHEEPARWLALPFPPGERPPSGRVSLALYRVAAPAADAIWAGLLLDEWAERIPAAAETTGIAVHYDDPGAEAPQAVLIAVPPGDGATWDLPTLEAILHETLDLAKIRTVDLELLGDYAQLLPAVYLAANAANDTVSTDLAGARVAGPFGVG